MAIDSDGLLKIVLVLVLVWLVLEILGEVVSVLAGPFDGILGLLIAVLIVLFLLDRL